MASVHQLREPDDSHSPTQTADILQIMLEIQQARNSVTLALPPCDLTVRTAILGVNGNSGHFFYGTGQTHEETHAVLSADRIHFSAAVRGAFVRFTTPTPMHAIFDGAPAFRSPLPADMLYLERREHSRTKFAQPYVCTARLADGTPIRFSVRDVSLGGVKLQSATVSPEALPPGGLLQDAVLDFLELGKVEVTLRITSKQETEQDGRASYLYGCRFDELPTYKQGTLQRLMFSLERLNRPNTQSTK
jgi:c-di-GMP-binding flagellar brake protein YcgR